MRQLRLHHIIVLAYMIMTIGPELFFEDIAARLNEQRHIVMKKVDKHFVVDAFFFNNMK